ncbi:MAG TPA: cytochrome D1 domain-containing protein [Pyrinomonadaceae bacterium]|nr:cytochrome D1 domain-containing protein [Pyrinomonadaceae bacterium]
MIRANRIFAAVVAVALAAACPAGARAQVSPASAKATRPGAEARETKAAPASVSDRFEKDGVRIDYTVEAATPEGGRGLVAGADAVVRLRITDANAGQPIKGLHPAAWVSSRAAARETDEVECRDKVRTFLGGLLSARPDVDLNSYSMLTLNHDKTITFLNPQISFSRTKIEAIVVLPARGADWALSHKKEFVYVSMPDASAVAVVDAARKKLLTTIPMPAGSRPVRVALQPDGRHVWIGLDGSPAVAVIDAATNKLARTVTVGAGLHTFAFTADGRFAYVTNSASDTVTAVNAATLERVADIRVGKTPAPAAYSSASQQLYVASINDGTVSVIDPRSQQVVKQIALSRGVVALRFDPSGRYGFAVNQVESRVSVIDAASDRVAGSFEVAKGPDQVVFTRGYAYFRATAVEKFSLVDLNEIAKGKFGAVDVQAGRKTPADAPEELGPSDMIAATPEGRSVMIANTPDQMIYYYVEGMMAPMGTFTNYKRRPLAILIVDRSLNEAEPGVYSATFRLTGAGSYDVPVLLDQPRMLKCFRLEVAESADGPTARERAGLAAEATFKGARFAPAEAVTLKFKITDPATGAGLVGLKDVGVLVFEPPGIWQQRQYARELGDGFYEVSQIFPRAGLYNVMLRVPSRGVTYADLPYTSVVVAEHKAESSTK